MCGYVQCSVLLQQRNGVYRQKMSSLQLAIIRKTLESITHQPLTIFFYDISDATPPVHYCSSNTPVYTVNDCYNISLMTSSSTYNIVDAYGCL